VFFKIGQQTRKDTDGHTTQQQAVFLTVHNAGANHQEWLRFSNHPAMAPIKNNSVFIHLDLPGQEANAELLVLGKDPAGEDKKFPTMQVSVQMGVGFIVLTNATSTQIIIFLQNVYFFVSYF
jgi:hypothetical protein